MNHVLILVDMFDFIIIAVAVWFLVNKNDEEIVIEQETVNLQSSDVGMYAWFVYSQLNIKYRRLKNSKQLATFPYSTKHILLNIT